MKKLVTLLIVLMLMVTLVACGDDAEQATTDNGDNGQGTTNEPTVGDDVVALVNDITIKEENFEKNYLILEYYYSEMYGEDVLDQEYNGQKLSDSIREQLLDSLIVEKLILAEVAKTGYSVDQATVNEEYELFLQNNAENEAMNAFYEDNNIDEAFIKSQIEAQLLAEEYFNIVVNEVSEDTQALEELYDTYKIEVEASHILVDTPELAEEILEKIEAGEDFADLAKEYSQDPGSAENGGSLGYFPRDTMVAEFEQAAYNMEVGEVSDIVQSQFGYHIIKVTGIHTVASLIEEGISDEELEEYKTYVLNAAGSEVYQERVLELYDNATIERFMN